MAHLFDTILLLPIHHQPPSDQLLARLVEGEYEYRNHHKIQLAIQRARFRYQVSLEEVHFLPARNLDQNQWLRLADCSFIDRAENILLTGLHFRLFRQLRKPQVAYFIPAYV